MIPSHPAPTRKCAATSDLPPEQFCVGHYPFTCTGASIGQVRRDSDGPALIHAHALQTFVDACDEATLTQHANFGGSSLVAAKTTFPKTKEESEVEESYPSCQLRGCELYICM